MTHFSDPLRSGDAYYGAANKDRGYQRSELLAVEFGAVVAVTATGVCVAATTTGAGALSATGSLVTAGVATFDVPRTVSITATTNVSSNTFTVTGTDAYGQTMSEKITGPNATTVNGAKAFKTVTSVTATGVVTAISAGTSAILGLPVRVGDKGKVLELVVDGISETSLTTVVGLSTTGVSTATTADVRGTLLGGTAPDGTKRFTTLLIVGDPNTSSGLYGVAQA